MEQFLIASIKVGDVEGVKSAFKEGADVNKLINGKNSLHVAVKTMGKNSIKILEVLFDNGGNESVENHRMSTPTMLAAA